MNVYYVGTTKANSTLTCGEDWLSISHVLSPRKLTIVYDESNDGEHCPILTAIILHN